MRRSLLLAALFALGLAATAVAHGGPGSGPGAPPPFAPPPEGEPVRPPMSGFPGEPGEGVYLFHVEVESTDAEAGTFEATVYHVRGPHGHERPGPVDRAHDGAPGDDAGAHSSGGSPGERPRPFRVTFRTDESTAIYRNGEEAAVGDLQAGDIGGVAIVAERGLPPEQVAERPAWIVAVHEAPAFYGFAGRVRGVDTEAGTLTLTVRYATRNARALLEGSELPRELTFHVDERTRIVVNGHRAALGDLEPGQIAGVGIVAPRRASLDEVLATPAEVVLAMNRDRAGRRSTARLGRRAARRARAARR